MLLGVLAIASLTYATTSDLPQTWLYYDNPLPGCGNCSSAVCWPARPRICGCHGCGGCSSRSPARDRRRVRHGARRTKQFPGPWALVPVGAALAIIVAGARGDDVDPFPTRLLASPPLVRLGSIAYALYLWHWPVLIAYLSGWRAGAGCRFRRRRRRHRLSLVLAELTTA